MDAFSVARQRAAATRAGLSAGFVKAYDVVEQAFAEAGFKILAEEPGVLLGGSHAKLLRDVSTVLVRSDVGRPERAVHLAHELGHVHLHAPHQACELDAEEADGAGSRALSRVETYGPRERRELQANVFAREFLLPSGQARQLFLDERLPASEIGRRLELPPALVHRQLADALFTCETGPAPDAGPPRTRPPDPSQKAAAESEAPALLVEAGPGSGKTKTLVARVRWLIARGVPASAILALTFSNKAAAELASRIVEACGDEAAEILAFTFHGFGLEILRRHYDRLGLPPKIRLIAPSQAVEMLEDRLPLLGLKHFHELRNPGLKLKELLKPIGRAKDELVAPDEFRQLAEAGLARAIARAEAMPRRTKADAAAAAKVIATAEKTLDAALVYEVYEDLLREKKLVDFADLVMKPTLLMEREDDVLAALRARHPEILVDEYQDVNRGSARMLKALQRAGSRLWVVGDARQSIYGWRGASSLNMEDFEADFTGGSRTSLGFNYRSSDHITALSRRFAAAMDVRHATAHRPSRRLPYAAEAAEGAIEGSETTLAVAVDDATESECVADGIAALAAAGVPYRDQGVLARVNSRLDTLAGALGRRGIPVKHLGSFFERAEVRDVLSILALVAEPNGGALARVAAMREVGVGAPDIAVVAEAGRQRGEPLVDVLADAEGLEGLTRDGGAALARLGRRLGGFSPHKPAYRVAAEFLFERSDYARDLAARTGIAADLERSAVRQLIEFLDQSEPDGRPLTAAGALRRVRTAIMLADDRDLRDPGLDPDVDAVSLLTVHAAKGLEYRAIHVVGLHEGGFPNQHRSDQCLPPPGMVAGPDAAMAHAEEEGCAFFVAISRAQAHLRLYHTRRANTRGRVPSPFLADLGPLARGHTAKAPAAAQEAIAAGGPIAVDELSLYDLRDYDKCPLRLAYRHRLGLRGRRHEGPYLKTAGVIYDMLDGLPQLVATDGLGDNLARHFDEAWARRGPVGSPLEANYKALALASLQRLPGFVAGFAGAAPEAGVLRLADGSISTPTPLIARRPGGATTARFVEAYASRSAKPTALASRLLAASAKAAAGERVEVEVAHLADGGITAITRSAAETQSDLEEASAVLSRVRSGDLPPKPQMHTCMRCAHFFACPAIGAGPPT